MTNDPYRIPDPTTWQPKSPFFKAIMAKVEAKKHQQEVVLHCPCCDAPIKMIVNLPPQP